MASVQDSNELLKTPDAAQITNPGRGYLKVGENEVYEMFQSGYAGVPYDPDQVMEEVVDERLYRIDDLGQTELLYDQVKKWFKAKIRATYQPNWKLLLLRLAKFLNNQH